MMKIAGVSMTYNDGYKLKEWVDHYNEYKCNLDYYIIVDNGSDDDYVRLLKESFSEAIIIQRETNGGCTAAYNDGIRYALEHTDADSIVIIGNDIKLSEGCLETLNNFLFEDESLGIVSTAILEKDSDLVDNYGHKLIGIEYVDLDKGKKLSELFPAKKYTDLVTGGFNMAKRQFYESVGLQDEKLFMYSDEIDTALRTKKHGYNIGVTCEVYAWHWHINEPNQKGRRPASNYLIARNKVYLSYKHFGILSSIGSFGRCSLKPTITGIVKGVLMHQRDRIEKAKYSFFGGINGLRQNMELNEYTKFR